MVTEAHLSKAPTKKSVPPEGYLCKVCKIPGHWIQQCPQKRKKPQKKSNPNHVHRPGIDPSPEDIERARALQKLKPPLCFCKISSRLKKVKRSFASSEHQDYPDYEHSRAIGNYFFFCSKKREDPSKCRFARPVQDELTPKAQRVCTFFAKNGSCKKGDLCAFSHEIVGSSISHYNSTKRKRESPHGSSRSNSSNNGEQQTPLKRTKETTTFAPKNNHSSSSSRNDSESSTSSDRTFETNKLQSQSNPNELMKDDASSSRSSDSDSSSSSSSNNDSDSSDAEDNDAKKVTTGNPVRSSAHDSNDSSSDSDSSSSSSSSDSEGEEEEPKRTTSSQKSSSATKTEPTSDSSSSSESDSD